MVRERIADDIYVFTSRQYAQVTAGAILTKEGVILIDTLFFPEETRTIKEFLENRLGLPIRYLINTHYHADHTLGNWLFPDAWIAGHAACRQLLDSQGRAGLEQMQAQKQGFEDVKIVLPKLLLKEGVLNIYLGDKTVQLIPFPGHSPDLVGVYVVNERILFASDTVMPVPTLFDGDYDDLVCSLERMIELGPDCVVQGHGEVILRGEVETALRDDLDYLRIIREQVAGVVAQGKPASALNKIAIESCGKSRIPLNGFVVDLHQANLNKLYQDMAHKPA